MRTPIVERLNHALERAHLECFEWRVKAEQLMDNLRGVEQVLQAVLRVTEHMPEGHHRESIRNLILKGETP